MRSDVNYLLALVCAFYWSNPRRDVQVALADPRGMPGMHPQVQILSFSYSFRQNIEK